MHFRNIYRCLAGTILCLFALSACNGEKPITAPVKIVAFGDSLTAGYRLPLEEAFPARLQERFIRDGHTGVTVINMGITGDTTRDGVSRLNLLLEAQPDVVILELGANDLLRQQKAENARNNLVLIIQQLQSRNISVILTGVEVPSVYGTHGSVAGEYAPMFKSLAEEFRLSFYPDFLKDVYGKAGLNQNDRLHPNAQGAEAIAERIYPLVLKAAREESGE